MLSRMLDKIFNKLKEWPNVEQKICPNGEQCIIHTLLLDGKIIAQKRTRNGHIMHIKIEDGAPNVDN